MNFAMITEGVSENRILTYIIQRYLGDSAIINTIQPEIQGGKQASSGGWTEVLSHMNDDVVNNVMSVNDYLVVQIDSDTCSQRGYDVDDKDENGQRVSDEELCKRIKARLIKKLSEPIKTKYFDRIIFAICINETECWLLPVVWKDDPKRRCRTSNCIHTLDEGLKKSSMGYIPPKGKNGPEARAVYDKILKKKDIPEIAQYNVGFKNFIAQLDKLKKE